MRRDDKLVTRVEDVMQRDVIVVGQGMAYKQLVEVLAYRQVRAVAVLDDDGRAVGIVSESDLLARSVADAEDHEHDPGDADHRHRHRHRSGSSHPPTAGQLMSTPLVSASPSDSIRHAAVLAVHAGVRQLPVIDGDGEVVGMVSRGDLLRTYLRPDPDIRAAIESGVLADEFSLEPSTVEVTVRDGIVGLIGQLETPTIHADLIAAVRAVAGVVAVEDGLTSLPDANGQRPRTSPHLYY